MLNYLSIEVKAKEDIQDIPSLSAYSNNVNLFADAEKALLFLVEMIEQAKKETAELFMGISIEVSKYQYANLPQNDTNPAGEESNYNNLLSRREKEVLQLVFEGMTNKEIAGKLFISFETVKSHRKNILSKTESKNTASLIRKIDLSGL